MTLNAAARLESLLALVPVATADLSAEAMIIPPHPGKWSRLQILGHLCDSALHNLTRFVHAQHMPEPWQLQPYNQDEWVAAQRYADAPIDEIVALWVSLNRSIVRVIAHLREETAARNVLLPSGETQTLAWLIDDYVAHMNHHLRQILPGEETIAE
ncbi:DinB family protein [Paenibacillus methanolicus]|uniref:DinB family protein n=1 Tax=Paenibacillus methanolicus TaxID=582686 RepID=A0A5S5C5V0_9BACL|nr:DinB family protein [Paenibacillus methanolicus]TYP74714.1 DinB family protein [Paenibacillus methanolicus]